MGKSEFFENAFSDNVRNTLLGKHSLGDKIDLMFPDNTSVGWREKIENSQWKKMLAQRRKWRCTAETLQ